MTGARLSSRGASIPFKVFRNFDDLLITPDQIPRCNAHAALAVLKSMLHYVSRVLHETDGNNLHDVTN